MDEGKETDLDEDEKDLNTKKVKKSIDRVTNQYHSKCKRDRQKF